MLFYYHLSENRMILVLLTLIDDASGCFVTPINRHGTTVAATSLCCFIRPGKTNYNVYKEKKESLLFWGVRVSRCWRRRRRLPVPTLHSKNKKYNVGCYFSPNTYTLTYNIILCIESDISTIP